MGTPEKMWSFIVFFTRCVIFFNRGTARNIFIYILCKVGKETNLVDAKEEEDLKKQTEVN